MSPNTLKFAFQVTQAQLVGFSIQVGSIRVIQCLYHALDGCLAQYAGIKLVLVYIIVDDDVPCLLYSI